MIPMGMADEDSCHDPTWVILFDESFTQPTNAGSGIQNDQLVV